MPAPFGLCGMRGSCTFVRENTTKTEYFRLCRIFEREVGIDDLRQAPGNGEQMG